MSDYEHAVFISYAWGEENEKIVNQLDQALQQRGMKIVRDKRDLEYTGSIKSFMERIGTGDCVIVVISDKYLKSPNCMFELAEIAGNKQFEKRIFPIVIADANIYNPKGQFQYIKHWEVQIQELKELLREVDPTNLQGLYEQLNLYDRIRDNISRLTAVLSDMNALTPSMHTDSGFNELYAAIERRMKERPPALSREAPRSVEVTEKLDFEPEMVDIAEGTFTMGSAPGDGIPAYEAIPTEVHLPAFRIGVSPITNTLFEAYLNKKDISPNPILGWDGQSVPEEMRDLPVAGVTWFEARDYCVWLSEVTGHQYSLPNEAQWEKACRGGNTSLYPWGNEYDPKRSNHNGDTLAAVKAFPPQNDFGLYDLVGNIRQWTRTIWGRMRPAPDKLYAYPWNDDKRRNDLSVDSGMWRVVRGCSYRDHQGMLRSAARERQLPGERGFPERRYGFRVVRND
jgi:formylglycine-generating enzyme required for sulfatase activity